MNGFSPQFLARLRKLRLSANVKNAGIHKGIRRSKKTGSSLEFSDFRLYEPGDDIRKIDWNIYGRTKRHYIRRYLDEQEINIAVYLDCTSSMRTIDEKWRVAKEIAAAISFMTLVNDDRLSFIPISSFETNSVARKGTVYAKSVAHDILNLEIEARSTAFIKTMNHKLLKGKQLYTVISDGMESIAEYESILKKLASQSRNVLFIQVLSMEELDPIFNGDAKLIDSELESEVNISLNQKITLTYKNKLSMHNDELEKLCRQLGMQYLFVSTEKTIEEIVMKDFVSHRIVQ